MIEVGDRGGIEISHRYGTALVLGSQEFLVSITANYFLRATSVMHTEACGNSQTPKLRVLTFVFPLVLCACFFPPISHADNNQQFVQVMHELLLLYTTHNTQNKR